MADKVQTITNLERAELVNLFNRFVKPSDVDDMVIFGDDEFPTQAVFLHLADQSDCFKLCLGNGEEAYALIWPSYFFRNVPNPYGELLIFGDLNVISKSYGVFLEASMQLVRNLKYEACISQQFISNGPLILCLREKDFVVVATIPRSGRRGDDLLDTIVFFKRFNPLDQVKISGSQTGRSGVNRKWTRLFPRNPRQPCNLPLTLKTKKGEVYMMDRLVEKEVDIVLQMMLEDAHSGFGYTEDELPSQSDLRECLDIESFVKGFAIRTPAGEFAGAYVLFPSKYGRSYTTILCDPWLILTEPHRGRGIYTALAVSSDLHKELGFEAVVTDIFVLNMASVKPNLTMGGVLVGCLPSAGYLGALQSYVDYFLVYMDMRPTDRYGQRINVTKTKL